MNSGIMSGGAEANFPLGYSVNVDSHVNLLKVAHKHAQQHFPDRKPIYVFVSSLAVYGGPKARPESYVKPEYVLCLGREAAPAGTSTLTSESETPALAETSYGCQKQIIELYTYDYGRKGFLETRSCRLPTVAIRSGAVCPDISTFFLPLSEKDPTLTLAAFIRRLFFHLWPHPGTAPRATIRMPHRDIGR